MPVPERPDTPEAPDPVAIVADTAADMGYPQMDDAFAGRLLSALHDAGWRIVREGSARNVSHRVMYIAERWRPDA